MTSHEQLRALGEWAERLAAPDFDFGHWVKSEQRADGVWTMPYFEFSPEALEFLRAAPVEVFAWPDWPSHPGGSPATHPRCPSRGAGADRTAVMPRGATSR